MKKYEMASNIYNARKECGISKEELAERAQISISTIRRIESGKESKGKIETVEKIANVLGVQIYDIVPEFNEFKTVLINMYDEEDDEEINEALRKQKLFYPNVENPFKYPIRTLLEFLNYLPLINWSDLSDILANRFNGSLNGFENYVCNQLKYLYDNIEYKDEKKIC